MMWILWLSKMNMLFWNLLLSNNNIHKGLFLDNSDDVTRAKGISSLMSRDEEGKGLAYIQASPQSPVTPDMM